MYDDFIKNGWELEQEKGYVKLTKFSVQVLLDFNHKVYRVETIRLGKQVPIDMELHKMITNLLEDLKWLN